MFSFLLQPTIPPSIALRSSGRWPKGTRPTVAIPRIRYADSCSSTATLKRS